MQTPHNPSPATPPSKVFIDLDGVIVDFEGYARQHHMSVEAVKHTPGTYLAMQAIEGALAAVREVMALGYEVWIASKPPTGVAHAYAEKAQWVFNHLPELTQRIIITHDKGLLGGSSDWLIDDRPHKANCMAFKGTLVHFRPENQWPEIVQDLRKNRQT